MTNEEAIGFLQSRIDLIDKCYPDVKDYREALIVAIKSLERDNGVLERVKMQEPCEDCISRQALRQKLQERHDFFVNAYEDMPLNDKARVDEISSCIAEVVNAPSVTPQPKVGEWLEKEVDSETAIMVWQSARCSVCDRYHTAPYMYYFSHYDYCPHCGSKMEVSE